MTPTGAKATPAIALLMLMTAAAPAFCGDWSPQLSAKYLDGRQKDWFAWPKATAAGGPCVSCHTGLPYLVARPALRQSLGEASPTAYESGLLSGLRSRMEAKDVPPPKTAFAIQAAGVEAVMAAFAFSSLGTTEDTRHAFDRLWALQIQEGAARGSWAWFNLNLDPYEVPNSAYFGAALAAVATGSAPAAYRDQPEVRERIAELAGYLERERQAQPLHHRLMLLWASAKLPAVLPDPARKQLIEEVWKLQQDDGSWTLGSLGPWKKRDSAPDAPSSSSYGTGLVAFTLEKAGIGCSDPRMRRALGWLAAHQDAETGAWTSVSMNKQYPPDSMESQFMRDVATGFASVALLDGGCR